MSVVRRASARSRLSSATDRLAPMRGLALLASLVLIGAFVTVLYGLVDVAGNTTHFTVATVASLAAATALARTVRPRVVFVLAAVLLTVGLAWYVLSLSRPPRPYPLLASNLELVSGQSLHQIRRSGTWAVAVTPAPVLVTWYLALRRRYVAGAAVGGATLGYLVLTGDAPMAATVLGMVGGAGMLGFGDLDRRSGTVAGAEYVAVVLAIMVVLPFVVTVIPAAAGSPLNFDRGGTGTLEGNLLDDQREMDVGGEMSLSPEVRFTIESPLGRYWKTNSFDRYTGDGWVRTGGTVPIEEVSPDFPDGPRRTIAQTVEVESRLTSLPAAWRPIRVGDGLADRAAVTEAGDLVATDPLRPGESYQVTSAVAVNREDRPDVTSDDAPETLRERYTRLPDSTPERVRERTATITAGADGPYETAAAVEGWLEENRGYSLNVSRPDGSIADAFLFEMEEGYCTYFATTMVVMLRSEGVPARLVTGYTTGQQVDETRWVVRGLDAHAWVEVYVEGRGWVAMDPTPSEPRAAREDQRILDARENNATEVDTDESRGDPPSEPTETAQEPESTAPAPAMNESRIPENIQGSVRPEQVSGVGTDSTGGSPIELPPRDHIALGAVVLIGAIAGVRRTGAARWLRRTVAVRWQRRTDPETDVERAFERVSIVLERRHRPRRPGETVRAYMAAIDAPPAARRVAAIRERARYGEELDPQLADEAVALADGLGGFGDGPNQTARAPDW